MKYPHKYNKQILDNKYVIEILTYLICIGIKIIPKAINTLREICEDGIDKYIIIIGMIY